MGKNKIIYDGTVLVDLTEDTVTEDLMVSGTTAHDKTGTQITGTIINRTVDDIAISDGTMTVPAGYYEYGNKIVETGGETTVGNVTASGGGGTSISFTGLPARPKMFSMHIDSKISASRTYTIISVMSDGSITCGDYYQQSSNFLSWGVVYHSDSYFSWTYSNGTLTIESSSSTNGGVFSSSATYRLIYVCFGPS